jgi:cytochrome c biogenesis protein CcmG/thiol:disulfide interchange protein DsbE
MNETISTQPATAEPAAEAEEKESTIRWSNILIWGGIAALLAVLGWGLLNSTASRPEAGVRAPTFDMQFFEGYGWKDQPTADLDSMRGNVVVLNFWASWCVECRIEADLLESAWRQYRDQGVVFLGVAYVDAEPKSLAYLEEFGITYPNAPDLGSSISGKYEITGVPETYFIDKQGTVSRVVIGPVSDGVLHNEIAQLLAQ